MQSAPRGGTVDGNQTGDEGDDAGDVRGSRDPSQDLGEEVHSTRLLQESNQDRDSGDHEDGAPGNPFYRPLLVRCPAEGGKAPPGDPDSLHQAVGDDSRRSEG